MCGRYGLNEDPSVLAATLAAGDAAVQRHLADRLSIAFPLIGIALTDEQLLDQKIHELCDGV